MPEPKRILDPVQVENRLRGKGMRVREKEEYLTDMREEWMPNHTFRRVERKGRNGLLLILFSGRISFLVVLRWGDKLLTFPLYEKGRPNFREGEALLGNLEGRTNAYRVGVYDALSEGCRLETKREGGFPFPYDQQW